MRGACARRWGGRREFGDCHLQGFEQHLADFTAVAFDFIAKDGAHRVDVRLYDLKAGVVLTARRLGHFVE